MICSSINVCASESLYKKYSYDENFEYEDEVAAHALKSAVVCIRLEYYAAVKYNPVIFDIDTINEYLDMKHEELSDEYTRDEIAALILQDMQNNIAGYLNWGEAKKIDVSLVSQGSGVIISEDGYIATNAHVVTLSDSDKDKACIEYLQSNIEDDINKVVSAVGELGISLNDEEIKNLYSLVLDETAAQYKISNKKESLYVCFPSASGETDIDTDRVYEAEVIEKGVPLDLGTEGTTQDAAILKIDETNLVALKLSDSYPESNSKIITAGFPVAADKIFQKAGSGESVLSVSIGTGNISRQIPIKGHDYKAMEITTTISGGNSGGPSIDSNLNIEGLNTYGLTEDMRFAYMIPAEYVADLSEDIDLVQDDVSKTFLTGLQMLQQDYGAAALECFEYVQDSREDTPYIENLIELAEKAPQEYPEGAEEAPKVRYVIDYELVAIIGGSAIAVIAIITAIIITVKSKKRKKADKNQEDNIETAAEESTGAAEEENDKSEV